MKKTINKNTIQNAEFNDPSLAAIYNTVCPLDGYGEFYLTLAKQLDAQMIIDLGCGTGLLTSELAKQGYTMIGVEPAREMLAIARTTHPEDAITWIEGDALSLKEYNADLVIMTAHVAQFLIKEDYWRQSLRAIYKALRPGGYLAFESRNPAVQPWNTDKKQQKGDGWYKPGFRQKVTDPVAGEIEAWSEITKIDGNRVTSDIHYLFKRTGEELLSRNELIFRTREEITQALEEVGFSVEHVYGDWDFTTATEESPEYIFVAKK
ncbi:MAG: class I SAM-dependent methyltransferase [Patescibacteria group bacterium]